MRTRLSKHDARDNVQPSVVLTRALQQLGVEALMCAPAAKALDPRADADVPLSPALLPVLRWLALVRLAMRAWQAFRYMLSRLQ